MQVKKRLKFCSWNIEGLSEKLDDKDFLLTINYFDCITLVENWLNNNTVGIQGFSFSKFRQKPDKAWRNSGGITVLVRSEFRKGIRFFDKESGEPFLWWKLDRVFLYETRFVYSSVYIPSQNSCCGNDLIILNSRTKGDYVGQYTCQTYNGASVVD